MRLVEYLFEHQGYNPLIRPVRNLTEKIAVKFGLAMIQLINVVRNFTYFILKILNIFVSVVSSVTQVQQLCAAT